jgi:hypothetical protein
MIFVYIHTEIYTHIPVMTEFVHAYGSYIYHENHTQTHIYIYIFEEHEHQTHLLFISQLHHWRWSCLQNRKKRSLALCGDGVGGVIYTEILCDVYIFVHKYSCIGSRARISAHQ